MKDIFKSMSNTLKHLEVVHEVFGNEENFGPKEKSDYRIYKQNEEKLREDLNKLSFDAQLYHEKGRQMILADFLEYIFLGRGYYSMKTREDRENFIKAILHFVNLLMCYEAMTVSSNLRKKFLEKLGEKIGEIKDESHYDELKNFTAAVGLKKEDTDAPPYLDKYFDSMLPKTAGGLWHELLVYIFLLRNNSGYIVPLLLTQRLMSLNGSIVPPDFLIITHDKRIYGIEVGTKKEIQSGSFSLKTAIPTATIDTINSRTSDRCPICKRWIPFCDFIISNYSDTEKEIKKAEIRCLEDCDLYSKEEISAGKCPYTKYSRNKAQTLEYTQHGYAGGLHYHYKCVLENVSEDIKNKMIEANDTVALKTHYPYYSGLEELIKKKG